MVTFMVCEVDLDMKSLTYTVDRSLGNVRSLILWNLLRETSTTHE